MTPDPHFSASFFEAWNAPSSDARHAGLSAMLSPDVLYEDPHMPAPRLGLQAYLEFSDLFRAKFPDLRFELQNSVKTHAQVLAKWVLRRPDDSEFSSGFFVFSLGAHGDVTRLTGFPSI